MSSLGRQWGRTRITRRIRLLVTSAGQGLTEYALIILFVVLVVVGVAALIGPQLIPMFTHANNGL